MADKKPRLAQSILDAHYMGVPLSVYSGWVQIWRDHALSEFWQPNRPRLEVSDAGKINPSFR